MYFVQASSAVTITGENVMVNVNPSIDNITMFDKDVIGFSEAYYVLWNDPVQKLSMVMRYVLFNGPTEETKIAEVWGWFRDRKSTVDVAIRQRYPLDAAKISKDKFHLEIGQSGIAQGKCWGEVTSDSDTVSWTFDMSDVGAIAIDRIPDMDAYELFPKFYSPYCKHTLSGRVTVNGQEYTLSNIQASDGHYWNTHHLQTWNWGNCVNFNEDDDFLFEGVSARFNEWSSPSNWMAFNWAGKTYQSNIVDSMFKNQELTSDLNSWSFRAELDGVLFSGEMDADPEDMILIMHPLPNGEFLYTTIAVNANLTLKIHKLFEGNWELVKTLTARDVAAFEVTKPVRNPGVKREFKIVPARAETAVLT
jgi:hypothetical protein